MTLVQVVLQRFLVKNLLSSPQLLKKYKINQEVNFISQHAVCGILQEDENKRLRAKTESHEYENTDSALYEK